MDPQWLEWAQRLQALAQNGLTFTQNPFDIERYTTVRNIAAEMIAARSGVDRAQVLDLFGHDEGYATPKVDVRGVVFRDDAVLLVQERSDGGWTLPGGWADVGASPAENVVREVYEESGYRTRAARLLAVYDRSRHPHPPRPFYAYKLFFLCELLGGEAAASAETSAVGFFREDELPPLSLARVTPGQIARAFEHYRHPDWPADFD